jgi:hypothetical protein
MKVLLIDADSKMPNLALMKLSAWHKSQGDQVFLKKGLNTQQLLFCPGPDIAYISCIFEKNKDKALDLAEIYQRMGIKVTSGGPAIGNELPDHIEHTMPDYGLYGADYSMGFTSRGCIRQCAFCKVWKLEGGIHENAPISEFHDLDHSKIMLLDNNILASPRWIENWNYILSNGLDVCMTQGFDARLITEDSANMIADARCFDTKFNNRAVYTAWDNIVDEKEVLRGIDLLIAAGIRRASIIVYMLVNFFPATLEQDIYRFKTLVARGVRPFVMPYNGNRAHPLVRYGQRPAIYMRMTPEKYIELRNAGVAHPEDTISHLRRLASSASFLP